MKYSSDQEQALDLIDKYDFMQHQIFQLGGYAGTGKTQLIPAVKSLMQREGYVTAVVAPTNKAAAVLRKRGIMADTIHGLMYEIVNEEPLMFERRSELEVDFVIVDEASMVGREMADDLESYSKPILYVGDPFQLPPVDDEEWFRPDFTLTNIHRTDKASIIGVASRIRETGRWPHHLDRYEVPVSYMASRDVVIVYTNALRQMINEKVRRHLGFEGPARAGEKVCVMKTDKDNGIYSGEIGVIESLETNYRFTVDFDGRKVRFVRASFVKEDQSPYAKELKGRQVLDFGYAITCHKAQGSQFDEVLVFDGPRCDARWMYTAITRAVKKGEIAG